MNTRLAYAKTRRLLLQSIQTFKHGRTCVGTESTSLVIGNSRRSMTTNQYQNRHLSSARPLPIDEHEDHGWNKEEEPIRGHFKRGAFYAHSQPSYAHEEAIMSPSIIREPTKESSSSIRQTESLEAEINVETMEATSPSKLSYTGDALIPITSVLHIVKPQEDVPRGVWPVFRLLDENGEFRNPTFDGFDNSQFESSTAEYVDPVSQSSMTDNIDDLDELRSKLTNLYPYQAHEINKCQLLHLNTHPYPDTNSQNTLLRAHRLLLRLRTMDTILQNAQRQGRISFYMTCTGEEAIHMGAASALTNQDPIFAQYREQGLLMWRGFTLEQFTNQCFSNDRDLGKGRQMPIHYGSRALNYQTVSSPLGTQLPQAVGAAYRLKLMKKPNVAICFFGDGCASTTDFHAALNFAATLSAPVIFFCRNNGYAISTPVKDQYAGDGIVSRATGYGMAAIRVDGNDVFAVHAAVREAKKYALLHNAPVLIEGMTYRLGHHSTSDDSTRYRSDDEVVEFADKMDPLIRLNLFLEKHNLITEDEIVVFKEQERLAVLNAIKLAEKRPKPHLDSMFEDVYKEMPKHLKKQLEELKQHVAKYPDKY